LIPLLGILSVSCAHFLGSADYCIQSALQKDWYDLVLPLQLNAMLSGAGHHGAKL